MFNVDDIFEIKIDRVCFIDAMIESEHAKMLLNLIGTSTMISNATGKGFAGCNLPSRSALGTWQIRFCETIGEQSWFNRERESGYNLITRKIIRGS